MNPPFAQPPRSPARRERLIALFLLGAVAFSPPLLRIFGTGTLFGWPLVYLYAFTAWAGLIAGVALLVERRPPDGGTPKPDDS